MNAPVGDAPTQITAAGNTQLLLAALAGIAAVVVLITVIKLHPFLSLLIASAVVALVAAGGVKVRLLHGLEDLLADGLPPSGFTARSPWWAMWATRSHLWVALGRPTAACR